MLTSPIERERRRRGTLGRTENKLLWSVKEATGTAADYIVFFLFFAHILKLLSTYNKHR